jgi:PadR family transcriptional regulator, regulatory protein PadR
MRPLMAQRDYPGEFEQLVLLAILRLGTNAYGMTIRREIEERAGRTTSIGALYLTLERLEQKDFVRSELGEVTQERGGRAKRFFSLNPSGREALRTSLDAVRKMADGYFPIPEAV